MVVHQSSDYTIRSDTAFTFHFAFLYQQYFICIVIKTCMFKNHWQKLMSCEQFVLNATGSE